MHPAASIVLFTTLSGAGLGLMAVLGLGAVPGGMISAVVAGGLAFALVGGGLLASTFHLGHPERAWRALTQWRSSWLSREGVLSLLTLALFAAYAGLWALFGLRLSVTGVAVAAAAAATVHATAMIYASLRTVPRWRTPLTPICYLLFAAAGGAILAAALAAWSGPFPTRLVVTALLLLALAWAAKGLWWARAGRAGLAAAGSSPETATGLGPVGRVGLFEPPHTMPNYLMKEMVFRIGRKHAARLRTIAVALGLVVPALLLAAALAAGGWPLLPAAALAHLLGVLVERWLFFAEAEHVVALYYGHR